MMIIVPLFEIRMIVMVRRDRAEDFAGLDSLAGKTASVQGESWFHTWLLDYNAARAESRGIDILLSDLDEPPEVVAAGRADFTLTDADIAALATNGRAGELMSAFAVGPIQELDWGVRKDSDDLAARTAGFFDRQRRAANSPLNLAWRAHMGVSILEYESLVRSLPNETGNGRAPPHE